MILPNLFTVALDYEDIQSVCEKCAIQAFSNNGAALGYVPPPPTSSSLPQMGYGAGMNEFAQ